MIKPQHAFQHPFKVSIVKNSVVIGAGEVVAPDGKLLTTSIEKPFNARIPSLMSFSKADGKVFYDAELKSFSLSSSVPKLGILIAEVLGDVVKQYLKTDIFLSETESRKAVE